MVVAPGAHHQRAKALLMEKLPRESAFSSVGCCSILVRGHMPTRLPQQGCTDQLDLLPGCLPPRAGCAGGLPRTCSSAADVGAVPGRKAGGSGG